MVEERHEEDFGEPSPLRRRPSKNGATKSDNGPAGTSGPRGHYLFRRASMIVAETGERLSSRDTNGGRRGSKSTAVSGKIRQKLLPEQPAWAGHPDAEPATESAPLLQGQSTVTEPDTSSWKAAVALAEAVLDSRTTKDVLKCAITYFVASLVVFTPLGTAIYGKSDNKHLVCTVSVYFHPARTLGSMAEAVKFVLISLSYSLVVAILSMETSAAFLSHGCRLWGYAVDLIVFCGGGLGLIAYAKQYVGKPTFNTACSLASIFLVTILTKEGNIQAGRLSLSKLLQSFMLVFSGAGLACFMCIVAWPQRAESELKNALNKAMDVYGEALEFALGKLLECERVDPAEFDKFTSDINASYEKTRKQLADARYELLLSGRESEYLLLERIVTSAQRLGLHLSGLVSSCDIQWNLLSMLVEGDMSSTTSSDGAEHDHDRGPSARSSGSYGATDTSIRSLEDERFISASAASTTKVPSENDLPYELLREFLSFVGPPMHSFVSTLRQIMDNLPFDDSPEHRVSLHKQYRNSLQLALDLFSATREDALAKMYSQESFRAARDFDDAVAEEAVAASCGNFSFVLEDFGEELRTFVDALSEYAKLTESGKPKRSWKWLKFWKRDDAMIAKLRPRGRSLDTHTVERVFGGVRPAPDSVKKSWRFSLWQSLRAFRRTDVQFGIKVGVGAIIFAIPAFAWTMRPTFSAWRGEWGLITYLVIMNKSVGGTTVTIPLRFVGTFLGAVLAYVAWTIFPYNPYLLSATGFLTSCACFYIILTWKTRNLFGRFILLTFNLVALYSYSISQNDNENDDDEGGTNPVVGYIAVHRFLAVTAGVLWAVCISALILPSSARRRLRVGLSIQWLRMGLIWKADPINTVARKGPIPGAGAVRPRSMSMAATDRAADDLLSQMETINGSGASGATLGPNGTILTDKDIVGIYGERELQGTMIELQTLLGHAPMELRIKGPFPLAEYKQMMQSTQKILDAYQNISVLISKNPNPTSKEYELIERTEADRREICGRVFLYFYLAASAIRMGLPLPDMLPSVVHAVDRMLVTLNEHRLASLDSAADDEDFVLFYTYTLVTLSIVEELTKITQTIQKLFGAIDDDKLFVG